MIEVKAVLGVAARGNPPCGQASALAAIHRAVVAPGCARLAEARFAHPGLVPAARFGLKRNFSWRNAARSSVVSW